MSVAEGATLLLRNAEERFTAIEKLWGSDYRDYAKRKNIGGNNSQKGTRYEDLFLAVKVAEMVVDFLDDDNSPWPSVGSQVAGLVDDVALYFETKTNYFQCKNAKSVSWTAGARPISQDFERQYLLAGHFGEPNPSTWMVVPSRDLKAALLANMPQNIGSHSDVAFFPYCRNIFLLVQEHEFIKELLRPLATVEAPSDDQLCGVLSVLLAGCGQLQERCHVRQILEWSAKLHPGQIRMGPASKNWNEVLEPALVEILAMMEGLSYDARRGFFSWVAFGTSGLFPFNCSDPRFKEFSAKVVENQPKSFLELEPLFP